MQKVLIPAAFILAALALALVTGVGPGPALAGSGQYIVDADEVREILGKDNVIMVDMQGAEAYAGGHIQGAVNIPRRDIVVNNPYPNLLPPREQIEQVLGQKGIDNETTVVIYDDSNNMDAARLWWTMLVYGHEDVRVVSGGFEALKGAGFSVSQEAPDVTVKNYTASGPDDSLIALLADVEAQVNDPRDDVILLDTRSRDEHLSGAIPGSLLVNYELNNFDDGTYRSVQHILLEYKERGITADKNIIIYCAVSVRGAQTFLALYNAGYRNLQLYDAAWAEYSDVCGDEVETDDPVEEEPEDEVEAPGG